MGGSYGSMVTAGTMIASTGFQALGFAAEAIHLVIQKIRERDIKVKNADVVAGVERYNWTELLHQENDEAKRNGTPGEDQEIIYKNQIIRRMKKYKRPTSIGTRRGYSLKINYGAERRVINHIVENYVKDMESRNRSVSPAIIEGCEKYNKAVDKVMEEDARRQKLIDLANAHIKELTSHVRTYIRKF